MPVRLEEYPIFGFFPGQKESEEFLVDNNYIDHLRLFGPARKYYDSDNLPDVLRTPLCIFEGLKRDEFERALCYCGKPPRRWNGKTDEPAPPGMVFLVLVVYSLEKKSWIVFDWEWFPEDDQLGFPKHWSTKYGRKIWPTS